MQQDPIEYAGPGTRSATKRSARQWAILLTVWPVGLVVWAIYLAAIVLLFIRVFLAG